jgi:hypothetical protein
MHYKYVLWEEKCNSYTHINVSTNSRVIELIFVFNPLEFVLYYGLFVEMSSVYGGALQLLFCQALTSINL